METQTFSPLICRTQAAPLTRRLLGNSLTTYNKLFCEKHIFKQTNFLNLCNFGLKAPSESTSEVPPQTELQQKIGDYQSTATAEHLLQQLKGDDMKFALVFNFKKDELQNGDTNVLKSCLKSIAEGVILNEQDYQDTPNKQLCAIMEKIRLANKGVNLIQAECIASKNYRTVFTQYQKPSVDDLVQPIKYFLGRKPIFCDKSTQCEHFKSQSDKFIQCDRIENGLRALHKTLKEELDMFSKETQCRSQQYITESLTSPIMKVLSSKEDNIMRNEFPLDMVHTSPPMPEDSLVIIRKKLLEKQYGIQPENILLYAQPIYDGLLNDQNLDKDLEWLAEETEPEYYSSTEVDGDSLLALDIPERDLHKYNEIYTNCDSGNNAQKTVRFPDYDQDDTSLVSSGADEMHYGTYMKNSKFHAQKPTKIPIPIKRKIHFQQLLQKPSNSKIQVGSSKNRFSDKTAINNATFDLELMEGNTSFADALYDCQKLSSKEPMEFFEQNCNEIDKSEEIFKTLSQSQVKQRTMKPKKLITFSTKLDENARNLSENEQVYGNEIASNEKLIKLNEVMPIKSILINGKSKNKVSYDKKQRQLVELIARGVEHEMLSNLEKENE